MAVIARQSSPRGCVQ